MSKITSNLDFFLKRVEWKCQFWKLYRLLKLICRHTTKLFAYLIIRMTWHDFFHAPLPTHKDHDDILILHFCFARLVWRNSHNLRRCNESFLFTFSPIINLANKRCLIWREKWFQNAILITRHKSKDAFQEQKLLATFSLSPAKNAHMQMSNLDEQFTFNQRISHFITFLRQLYKTQLAFTLFFWLYSDL